MRGESGARVRSRKPCPAALFAMALLPTFANPQVAFQPAASTNLFLSEYAPHPKSWRPPSAWRSRVRCHNSPHFKYLIASAVIPFRSFLDTHRKSAIRKKYLTHEGRIPDAILIAGWGRCLRAASQAAPGRLRASCPPVLRPVRGVHPLDWDRSCGG